MEEQNIPVDPKKDAPFRLNYKRCLIISLCFLGIMMLWQVYNSYCAPMLTDLFAEAIYHIPIGEDPRANTDEYLNVQYIVGIIMAIDNIAALIMLPIFGRLSDKTKTRFGKRMPYIMIGTLGAAIAFPFVPLLYIYSSVAGMIVMMAVVVFFMMMYRNPAVALQPDVTPKPLRSRANGLTNCIGFVGGLIGSALAMFLAYSDIREGDNPWLLMIPFIATSVVMVVTTLVVFFLIKENKIAEEMGPELARGELYSEAVDIIDQEEGKMSKGNKRSLIFLLVAEMLWFMGFNAIETFIANYGIFYLNVSSSDVSLGTIILSVVSFFTFMVGGFISEKIGRKWTVALGLAVLFAAFFAACFVQPTGVIKDPSADIQYYTMPMIFWFIFALAGIGWAFINTCSFPMVIELGGNKEIGKFTGYYYAISMGAQSLTSIAVGGVLSATRVWISLLAYSTVAIALSFIVFLFVKAPHRKANLKHTKGIDALDGD